VIVRTEDRLPRAELGRRLGMTYEEIDALVFGCESAKKAAAGEITETQHWQVVCEMLNLPAGEVENLRSQFFGGDRLDEELVGYIRRLRPRYITALLSNAWSNLRRAIEQEWGFADAFDELFISAEMGLTKPDPRIYGEVIERLAILPEEAVFVDDFLHNVEAAREAGLNAVQFINPSQAIEDLERLFESDLEPDSEEA
jgi:epoxide hydrolase-like predicted phosphatase